MLAVHQLGVVDAGQPQEIGAAALEEFEVACMVDDAGKVGVCEVDAGAQPMAERRQFAGQRGSLLGCHGLVVVVRHSSSKSVPWSAARSAGAAMPRCFQALAVRMRPRGVRWMKPCWIR